MGFAGLQRLGLGNTAAINAAWLLESLAASFLKNVWEAAWIPYTPSPISITFKYTSKIRSLDQKISLGDFNPGEDLELVKNYIKYFNFLVVFRSLIENEKSLSEFGFEFPTELKNYFEEFTKDETYKEDKFMLTYLKK